MPPAPLQAPASLYYAEGSAYERVQASSEVSRKYSAAAKALQGEEGMEGSAGARSRPVTGERERFACPSVGGEAWTGSAAGLADGAAHCAPASF